MPAPVEVLLTDGVSVTVGRDPSCTVVIDDARISREHLRIDPTGLGAWVVVDRGSRNSTFHDGALVREVSVRGDVDLTLGHPSNGISLRLRVPPPTASRTAAADAGETDATTVEGATTAGSTRAGTGPPRVVTIGRASDNDVVLDHPTVSAHHAVVTHTPSGAHVVDIGSRNGVFVDGRAVRRAQLPTECLLTLGGVDLHWEGGHLRAPLAPAAGAVVLDAVTVRRGRRQLRHGVSERLPAGRLTAIIGPSGAGKSTLMATMTGALRPSSGRVLVDGHDVARSGAALRHRIGVVPQDDVLHASLTVRQSLRYSARLRLPADTGRVQRDAEVDRVLATLHLREHASTRISRLSGGQRRRMNAASELITRPSLLVLDEPTSGLDPHLERLVAQDLAALTAQGCTVVIITHSPAVVDLADHVVAVAAGQVVYSGAPDGLTQHFAARGMSTVFAEIGGPDAESWAQAWSQRRTSVLPGRASGADVVPLARPVRGRGHARVLAARQIRLLVAERGSLALLLAQAPALGLLTRLFGDGGGFGTATSPNPDIRKVLLVLVLSATWLGTFASVRAIVDERRIVDRERAAGVGAAPYALAKAGVLCAVGVVQVACLLVAALAGRDLPVGRLVPWPGVELGLTLVLAAWASVAVGLLVSALARSGTAAAALAPLVVIPQLLLCGALVQVEGDPALDAATRLVSARAAFSAAASSTRLVRLEGTAAVPGQPLPAPPPVAWSGTASTWLLDVGELALLAAAAWFVLWLVLRTTRSASR